MSLLGKTVVFTGALQLKRADATAMAKAAGATVPGSVSGKTNIVVAGLDAVNTQKVKDAQSKGTVIWDEDTFIAACKPAAKVGKGGKVGKVGKAVKVIMVGKGGNVDQEIKAAIGGEGDSLLSAPLVSHNHHHYARLQVP